MSLFHCHNSPIGTLRVGLIQALAIMSRFAAVAVLVLAFLMAGCWAAAKPPISVDLDGDGTTELVTLKQRGKEIQISIAGPTITGGTQLLSFGVDAARQDAVCGLPVELEVTELDCRPLPLGEDLLEGCLVEPRAEALMLSDGLCDPIHLYWNHAEKRVWWWRM